MPLTNDAKERKATPIYSGVVKYFPLALAEVARVSKAGNDQHNPGQPLHWDKSKSTDHLDCIMRHISDAGTMDSDGQRHSAKVAWRALAALEMELTEEVPYEVPIDKGSFPQAMIDDQGRDWSYHSGDDIGYPCSHQTGCNYGQDRTPCIVVTPNTICSCHP